MGCACSRSGTADPAAHVGPKESPMMPGSSDPKADDQGKMDTPSTAAGTSAVSCAPSFHGDASPATPGIDAAGVHAPSAPLLHEGGAMSPPGIVPVRRDRPARTMPSSLFTGAVFSGFKTIPEIPAMSCKDENVSPHTMPPQALVYEPLPENVVTKFKNGDAERKIHNNIRLSESEIAQLQAMRAQAKVEGMEFYPSVTAMATRFLSRARLDPKKALKLMQDTQDWRKEYFSGGPITDEQVMEDMKHGIVYFSGRDFALRPAIIIRANRIPQQWYKDRDIGRFIRMLIFCMEYFMRYMVVPGKVENLSVIVDLQGLGIAQVPLGPLGEVYKVMSQHYIGRVFKFYVVNMSSGLSMIAGMAKGFLTDRQKQKLNMLDDVSELRKEFAMQQLEQDLGGSRPLVKRFFPFDLVPGPFEPGYSGPSDEGAVPNAHEILSHAGAMGRLWDPKLSAEENTRYEYGPNALQLLQQCQLPIPPELRYEGAVGVDFGMGVIASADPRGCGQTVSAAGLTRRHGEEEEKEEKEEKVPEVMTSLSQTFQEEREEQPVGVCDNPHAKGEHSTEMQSSSICGGFLCCNASQ